jgi:membrane protease YdiL (CAAX protease family)
MLSVKPWRAEAVLFFIAVQIFCLLSGGMAIALLQKAGLDGFKSENDFGYILVGTLSFQGATWVLMAIFFRYHQVDWGDALGFRNKNWGSTILLALGVVIIILLAAAPLETLSIDLMKKIHWTPKDEEAVTLLTDTSSHAAQIYLVIFAVLIAPVAEEFIFRGVLFPFLKQHNMPKTAWLGLNLFFAFMHADAAIFIPLFVLSIALTWLYEKTDNLFAPIFAHALFNAANLILLKYSPQLTHASQ